MFSRNMHELSDELKVIPKFLNHVMKGLDEQYFLIS